ncbi:rhamnulokinase [Barnesiella propionica]|uniref:rhamnulokinase n=1 Tax=Barnesiella propionica TaxID=2981781 RepID=UPI0011C70E03|nr:rhamnulokinase family protein [Barnesiella propionica]MCU6768380.1 rhamnulokinase [Barnesiella propionica]
MKETNILAIDLGATSGRAILARLSGNDLHMQEISRFPNKILEISGRFYWNIYSLYEEIIKAIRETGKKCKHIDSIGIDTWGVDFVYVAEDGTLLGLPRSYRDPYTSDIQNKYFSHIPKETVYNKTGIQFLNFNSLFQIFAASQENNSALKEARSILFIPDALSYLLTGNKVCEYTILSTSQFLNAKDKSIDNELLKPCGIDSSLFPKIVMPGTVIGTLSENILQETGINYSIPVIAVAGHDTGSAVAAVPAPDENFAYLSSGTWSLMGIETRQPIISLESFKLNFTNEGGIDGTTRFLKNITGMWILEQCRKEWKKEGHTYDFDQISQMADSAVPFLSLIDPDAPDFANPHSMAKAITDYCDRTDQPIPQTHAQLVRCILDSLALKYRMVIEQLKSVAPFPIDRLHIIGGGAQNKLLNQFTANATGLPVIAGPAEATAIGNIMVQAKAVGLVNSLLEMRELISRSVDTHSYEPQDSQMWEQAYEKFKTIICH